MENCVFHEWIFGLTFRQQTLLVSALRNYDGADKQDPSKKIVGALRGLILKPARNEESNFMRFDLDLKMVEDFSKGMDKYPLHFILHLIYAIEIVGYFHPEKETGKIWKKFYLTLVKAMHMAPETKKQNLRRLTV